MRSCVRAYFCELAYERARVRACVPVVINPPRAPSGINEPSGVMRSEQKHSDVSFRATVGRTETALFS